MKGNNLYCFGVFLVILGIFMVMIGYNRERFQSYAYPSQIDKGWDWNWWRRWYDRPWWHQSWKPRCPSGCQWVGGKTGYACPNGSFCYGSDCCKYDFECKGCSWGYDGPRGYGQF